MPSMTIFRRYFDVETSMQGSVVSLVGAPAAERQIKAG